MLPANVVWALHPADGELRSDVSPRVIVVGRPPFAWRGWRLVQLDLRGASWLGLDGGGRRTVRGRTKPVLRTGLPVPGVTAAGRPVYAGPPEVLLPPGPGTWRVEARRAFSGAVLAKVAASGDAWQPGSLWRKAPRPLLGELVITVTGLADTAGLRRTVIVAEAVGVTSYPAPRLTSPGGLEPGEVVIAAPPGMTVSPSALRFAEDAATREVTCVAGQVVLRIAVTPPHIRMRIDPEPGGGGRPHALARRRAAPAHPRRPVARRRTPDRPAWGGVAAADHAHLGRRWAGHGPRARADTGADRSGALPAAPHPGHGDRQRRP